MTDTSTQPDQPQFSSVSFFIDENKVLYARLKASENPVDYSLESIKKQLVEEGFGNYPIEELALKDLLEKIHHAEQTEMFLSDPPSYCQITFDYHPDTRKLHALLSETDEETEISFATLQRQIELEGYSNFGIRANILSDIIGKAQRKQFGDYVVGEKPVFTQVSFALDEDSGTLFAVLNSSEEDQGNSLISLQQSLTEAGYDNFFLESNALENILRKSSSNERGRYVIGEKRDARIHITFDEELMTAYLTVTRPYGGRDLDEHLLNVGLADAGIDLKCCDNKVIEKILKNKEADKIAFAFGMEPVDGKDTRFEALVEEIEQVTPKESKTGKIDLREFVNFTQVDVGEALMRRIPAKPGVNGQNVKGQVIPAVEGEDIPFNSEITGAVVSSEDDNLLVASERGHPVILKDGVRVDKTLVVNNVDLSSGNINYDGSLMVKGEIFPGMKVRVTGDIVVQGVVSKASVHAKNNIKVMCGIIGSDPSKDGEESPPAIIKAGGNVSAQYATLCKITAGNDVEVKEYLSHCTVEAKNKILVGQNGGKGKIFGGTCYAQLGIAANSLGSDGSVKTFVSAGTPHHQQKQYEMLQKSHESRQEKARQLKNLLVKYSRAVKENPNDVDKINKIKSVKPMLDNLLKDIEKMESTIATVNRFFKEGTKASVVVRKSTFPNVLISINGAEFTIRQESKGGTFIKEGNDIRWQS